MNQRDYKIDNIKAFMIFLVVFCHCIERFQSDYLLSWSKYIYNLVYSFHMPVFVFISGYLTHPHRKNYHTNTIINCIIPYLLFNTIHQLLSNFSVNVSIVQHNVRNLPI